MNITRKIAPHRTAFGLGLVTLATLGMTACPRSVQAQTYGFTTFNAPNATNTYAHGINNSGQIVGRYDSGSATTSGFSANAGSLTPSGFTSYSTGDAFAELDSVNNSGQVVGDYTKNSDGTNPGFLLNGSTHTDFNPGGTLTIPAGINTSGAVSGTAYDANYIAQGFVRSSSGTVTYFNDPKADAQGTFGTGINDIRTLVGYYYNSGAYTTAFLDKAGTFTDLAIPSLDAVFAYEINAGGDIVGSYQTPGTTAFNQKQGFLLMASGTFLTLNFPGAVSTEIFGVNDSRQVVGDWTDAAGTVHGFFAAPTPEPSAWAVLGVGAIVLAALAHRRHRQSAAAQGKA